MVVSSDAQGLLHVACLHRRAGDVPDSAWRMHVSEDTEIYCLVDIVALSDLFYMEKL